MAAQATTKKVRVFELAKTLGKDTKLVIDYARDLGYDVKNQLSSLDPDQADAVKARIAKAGLPAPTAAAPTQAAPLPRVEKKIHSLPAQSATRQPKSRDSNSKPVSVLSSAFPGIDKLLTIGEPAGLTKLDRIPRLAEIDPDAAMFKIRQLTERFCRLLLRPSAVGSLDDAIKQIEKLQILGQKAVNDLHYVRKSGNIAVHSVDDVMEDDTDLDDVDRAANALAAVIRRSVARGIIKSDVKG